MSSILLLRIASLHKFCFVLECFHIRSCCSIFNDQPRLHPVRRDSLYIIPQSLPFVNTFFKSFFTFFKVFFVSFAVVSLPPSWTAYILYHFSSLLSIPFLKLFWVWRFKLFNSQSASVFCAFFTIKKHSPCFDRMSSRNIC